MNKNNEKYNEIYLGPTIQEHCIRKISEYKLKRIKELYLDNKMLWSEYVTTNAENYMKEPLC